MNSLVTAMESLHKFTDMYGNTFSFGPNSITARLKPFWQWSRRDVGYPLSINHSAIDSC